MNKKIYLSKKDSKVCGVCGGLAEYFDIDSTIIRIIWLASIVIYGSGLLLYFICALVIPKKED